jgi:hypothetical protein
MCSKTDLESREYGRRDPSIRKVGTNFADKRRSLSVGVVRSRTQATKFSIRCSKSINIHELRYYHCYSLILYINIKYNNTSTKEIGRIIKSIRVKNSCG